MFVTMAFTLLNPFGFHLVMVKSKFFGNLHAEPRGFHLRKPSG